MLIGIKDAFRGQVVLRIVIHHNIGSRVVVVVVVVILWSNWQRILNIEEASFV